LIGARRWLANCAWFKYSCEPQLGQRICISNQS
jgi:hypothetical protein